MGMREQMRNLALQSSCVDDLSQGRVGRQRQQVTRDVERPGPQRALVSVLLHLSRLRGYSHQVMKHLLRKRFVLRKKVTDRVLV